MKKTILALFAVLLVLSLASCGDDSGDGANQSNLPSMVTLTINVNGTGTGRKLDATIGGASAATYGANYYEVVFKKGSDYYQKVFSATNGTDNKIQIPTADYSGVGAGAGNDAILFAGRNNGTVKTLLGVGVIVATTGGAGAGANANITPTITGVTFQVTSFANAVSATAASSTFFITSPASDDVNLISYVTKTTTDLPAAIHTTATNSYPVFPIPAYGYPTGATGKILASYGITTVPHNTKVLSAGNWDVTVLTSNSTPNTLSTVDTETTAAGAVTIPLASKSASPAAGTALGASLTLTFEIQLAAASGSTNGVAGLLFDVPVRATPTTITAATDFKNDTIADAPVIWSINGGSDLTLPDGIGGPGALVLLGIGVHDGTSQEVTINPGTWN